MSDDVGGNDVLESPVPEQTADSGRDPCTGRFRKGNSVSRGNGEAGLQSHYRRLVRAAVTDEDVEAIARNLVSIACSGDKNAVSAADLLFAYMLGKPTMPIMLETQDARPIRILGPTDPVPTGEGTGT